MKKTKLDKHKHWTVELNIGSKKNMGKLNHSKRIGYYHSHHDLNTVRNKVKNRFDGGNGNVIKSMFEFDGTYNDEIEKTYYISFTFYGGIDYMTIDTKTQKPISNQPYMNHESRKILEDKLTILCMELEQECIAYNIKEWEPNTMYPVGKQDLIYHPNYIGDQMVFEPEYFTTFKTETYG